MNDFFDSLKDIKKELEKDKKPKKTKSQAIKLENFDISEDEKAEFASEFDLQKESITSREKRLQNEFLAYIKGENIKKIDN